MNSRMENIVYLLISKTTCLFETDIKTVLRHKRKIRVLQIATSSRIFQLFKRQYKNYTKTLRDYVVNLIHYTHLHKTVERTLKYLLPKLYIRKPI